MDLAYLDAGSGSLIVQAVVAGAAGVMVFISMTWRRIKGFFRRKPAEATAGTTTTSSTETPETVEAVDAEKN